LLEIFPEGSPLRLAVDVIVGSGAGASCGAELMADGQATMAIMKVIFC